MIKFQGRTLNIEGVGDNKVTELSTMFTIETCAYALMSNYYHLVLEVDKYKADTLSDHDVALREKQLFSGHIMGDKWLTNKIMIKVKENKALELIKTWRTR